MDVAMKNIEEIATAPASGRRFSATDGFSLRFVRSLRHPLSNGGGADSSERDGVSLNRFTSAKQDVNGIGLAQPADGIRFLCDRADASLRSPHEQGVSHMVQVRHQEPP
jgi:hypothetical protein